MTTDRNLFRIAVASVLAASLAACTQPNNGTDSKTATPKPGSSQNMLPPAPPLIPADWQFVACSCSGSPANDVENDAGAGNEHREFAGNATYPAFLRAVDNEYIYFRMRM